MRVWLCCLMLISCLTQVHSLVRNSPSASRGAMPRLLCSEGAMKEPPADIAGVNSRFWRQTTRFTPANEDEDIEGVMSRAGVNIDRVTTGFAMHERNLVPIHSGRFQFQHATIIPGGRDEITVCGYLPRASQVDVAPSDDERPINIERKLALDLALEQIANITAGELLGAKFAGTPPTRIYRSFVSPRPKAVFILESVERAANRTANQIELGVRQVLADQSAFLRNTDKSILSLTKAGQSLNPVAIVLDNVRSAFNVGSIFRTAETAGTALVVTCGITCHPPHPKLMKTALSSVESVPTRHFESVMEAIEWLRADGWTIVVMETTERSEEYSSTAYPPKTALVVGNEVSGVDVRLIALADKVVQIPTYGVKNSLNVASALPIVLFEVLRQWKQRPNPL